MAFLTKPILRGTFATVLVVTVALMAVAYFRVLFTEAGYKSIGRAWYYFRDYADFGLSPTSLVGTILSPFMSYPIPDHHVLAWQIQGVVLLVGALLVLFSLMKYVWPISSAWAIALISSVSILPHMAYNLGNLDNILAILAIVAVLGIHRTWLVVLICIAGPLVHSMFVFALYPCILFLVYLLRGASWHLGALGVTMIFMVGVILFGMAPALDEADYAALMLERVPGIVRNGSFEYFASIEDSFNVTWQERRDFGFPAFWFTLSLAHVLILLAFITRRKEPFACVVPQVLALSAPLVLIMLITDIYRLIAWVGFNVMLSAIYLAKYRPSSGLIDTLGSRNPRLLLAGVLPWMLLGPMGVTCYADCGATAFPFFKRLIEAF